MQQARQRPHGEGPGPQSGLQGLLLNRSCCTSSLSSPALSIHRNRGKRTTKTGATEIFGAGNGGLRSLVRRNQTTEAIRNRASASLFAARAMTTPRIVTIRVAV